MKIFLSGSKTIKSLPESLTALLDDHCQQNCEFLIGDCAGADILMQQYLYDKGYRNVTVYVSGGHIRHSIDAFPVKHISVEGSVKGFASYRQKDIAMVNDYDAAQTAIIELENKIRKAKHTLNVFNASTVVPGFDMMLIYLPQLTHRESRLARMKAAMPKERQEGYSRSSTIIEYSYANYDIDKANADYLAVSDELARAQTALDLLNSKRRRSLNS